MRVIEKRIGRKRAKKKNKNLGGNKMKKLAEKTFYVGNMTDEEGEQFKAKAEALLAKELTEYEFTVSIAYLEGEEPTVVAEIEKGDMRIDEDLEKKINAIINKIQ